MHSPDEANAKPGPILRDVSAAIDQDQPSPLLVCLPAQAPSAFCLPGAFWFLLHRMGEGFGVFGVEFEEVFEPFEFSFEG